MTPMSREMVSQVMVSQVLPAERGGGTSSGRWVPRNRLVAKRLTAPWEPEGAHMGSLVSEPPGPESPQGT